MDSPHELISLHAMMQCTTCRSLLYTYHGHLVDEAPETHLCLVDLTRLLGKLELLPN